MNVIEVRGLRFKYRRSQRYVLDGINLNIRKGEFLGIVGPSGSGKSTLCLTFNGIIPHSIRGDFEGEVIVTDPETGKRYSTNDTPVPKLSTIVGLVLQNPESQLFNMTVEEEVAFALENLGLPREEMLERIEWALRIAGLEDKREEFPPNLSGGEQQRLAIAAILAMKPKVLVLDEPTTQLDPAGRRSVLEMISKLNREEGITIVLVDHNTDFLFRRADRIVVINSGRIILEGTPKELIPKIGELKELGIKLPPALEAYTRLKSQKSELAEIIIEDFFHSSKHP
ncbi:MAG: ATP-binding cassette domain-containing protein [Thermococcus sp.]|nr:ATP-binding cassette domain-containing protein [Thermococcus sp.]